MNYDGGSMLSGNNLEKLFEFEVKNFYTLRHSKQKNLEKNEKVSLFCFHKFVQEFKNEHADEYMD